MSRFNRGVTGFNIRMIVGMGLLTAIVVILQFIGASIKFGTFSVSLVLMPIVIGAALYGVIGGAWLGFVFGVVVLLSGDAALFLGINPFGTIVTVILKGTAAGALAGLVYQLFSMKPSNGKLAMIISNALLIASGAFLLIFGIMHNGVPAEQITDETIKSASGASTFFIIAGAVLFALGTAMLIIMIVKKVKIDVSTAVFASAITCPIVNTGIFLLGCLVFFMPTIREWAGDSDVGTFMIVGLVGFNFIFELAVNLILSPAIVMLIRYGEKTIAKRS